MGAGKTSVLDALCFALYGTFPALKQKRIKVVDLIKSRPEKCEKAEIKLVFSANGKKYEVKRIIPRKGNAEAILRDENGKMLEYGPQQVNQYIERILQTDYDLFFRAIYSVQNGIDHFLTLPKGERKREIDETLGLDRFENARKNLNKIINLFIEENKQKTSLLNQFNIEEVKKEKKEINDNLEKLKKEKKHIDLLLENISQQIIEIQSSLNEKIKLMEKFDGINKEIAQFNGALASLNSNHQQLIKEMDREIDDEIAKQLFEKITNTKTLFSKLEKKKSAIESTIEMLLKEKSRIEKEKENIELFLRNQKIDAINIESVENEKIALEQKNLQFKIKYDELGKEIVKITGLSSKLFSDVQRLQKLEKSKSDFELQLNKFSIKDPIQIQEKIKELNSLIEEKTIALASANSKISDLNFVLQQLENTAHKCPTCDSNLSEIKRRELIEKRQNDIVEINNEIEKWKREILSLKNEQQSLSEDMKKLEKLSFELKNIENEIKSLFNAKEQFELYNEKSNELSEEYEKIKSELEKNQNKINEYSEMLSKSKISLMKQAELVDKVESLKENEKFLLEKDKERKEIEQKINQIDILKIENDEKAINIYNQISNIKKQISEIEKKKDALLFEISNISVDKNAIDLERKKLNELLITQGDKKALQASNNAEIISLTSRFSQIDRLLSNAEKMESEIIKNSQIIEFCQKFQNAVVFTQSALRTHLIKTINLAISQLWPVIYAYENYEELRLDAKEDDYVLQMKFGEDWVDVDGVASGGERSSACLALRIALAMALAPNLSWIILDEPTHNLDSEGVKALANALKEKIPEIVDQVFVITHDDALKDSTESQYTFSKDENETSLVSKNGGHVI